MANKNKFRVTYKLSETRQLKGLDAEKLLPVFRELANIFSVNIAFDYGNGSATEIREDIIEPGTINFHIDTFPSRFHVVTTLSAPSVFSLIPNQPILIEVAAPYKNMMQYQLARTDLYSPENQPIGCILGSHIFIYPRILTADNWLNEDNIKLLWAIAYWFWPKTILNVLPNHGANIASGLNILRSTRRDMYLPHYATIDKFKETFRLFINNINSRALEGLEKNVIEAEKRLEKLSCDYFDSIGQNVQNMTRLEMITTEVSSRDLGKEFESLLTMESIETVRIKDGRYLLVKTCPIFQIPAVDHEKKTAEAYDIGEFIIQIDTVSSNRFLSHSAIKFFQDSYSGPFSHIHISLNSNVCFGNINQPNNIGLNTIIDGLIAGFDVVSLVHLILTFMKKERNKPNEREKWDNSIRPQLDYYKSAAEREEEKNNFIRLVADVVLRMYAGHLEKEISDLNQKIHSIHAEIIQVKRSLQNHQAMLEKLNDFLADTKDINKEAAHLLDEPSIFGLFISAEELVIHFHCPRTDLLDTAYLPEDFILKLNAGSTPRLLNLSPKKSLQNIQLIDIYRLDPTLISGDDETMIHNMHFGHISKMLETIKQRIINKAFDQRTEISTKREVKNGQ